jgi:hypothetical protein
MERRVHRCTVKRIETGDADSDLVHVRLSDDHRSGGTKPRDDRRIGVGVVDRKETGSQRGGKTLDVEFVLDRDRYPFEDRSCAAAGDTFRRVRCLTADLAGVPGDERVQRGISPILVLEDVDDPLRNFLGREGAVTVSPGVVGHRGEDETVFGASGCADLLEEVELGEGRFPVAANRGRIARRDEGIPAGSLAEPLCPERVDPETGEKCRSCDASGTVTLEYPGKEQEFAALDTGGFNRTQVVTHPFVILHRDYWSPSSGISTHTTSSCPSFVVNRREIVRHSSPLLVER